MFGWIEGELLADAMNEPSFETYGEVTARLHAQALGFQAPAGMKTWDSPYPRQRCAVALWASRIERLLG